LESGKAGLVCLSQPDFQRSKYHIIPHKKSQLHSMGLSPTDAPVLKQTYIYSIMLDYNQAVS
jgi:hypothetical protein